MKRSVAVAVALLGLAGVGTVAGVAARLPYRFGGVGQADRVMEDVVTKGTAVSPPLVALVVLVVAALIASARGRPGRIGSGLLALLSVVFVVPTAGELLGAQALGGMAQLFVILWSLLGVVVMAAMFVLALREALGRT